MDERRLLLEAVEILERYRNTVPVEVFRRDIRPVIDQIREHLFNYLLEDTKRRAAQYQRSKTTPHLPDFEELDTVPQSLLDDDTVPQKFTG